MLHIQTDFPFRRGNLFTMHERKPFQELHHSQLYDIHYLNSLGSETCCDIWVSVVQSISNMTAALAVVPINAYQHMEAATKWPPCSWRHFPMHFYANIWILITISLKFVAKGPINNIPAMVQIIARRRPGDKPLSEPMMVILLMRICVTRPQWAKCQSDISIPTHSFVASRHDERKDLVYWKWKYKYLNQCRA